MSLTVCLLGNTIHYPRGGGHFWVYLNWALGLRAAGCRLIWLERIDNRIPVTERAARIKEMQTALARYGLDNSLAVCLPTGEPVIEAHELGCMGLEDAIHADLLLNMLYFAGPQIVAPFRRTALLDIDPGLLQVWMSQGLVTVQPHHRYFTIGENVGQPHSKIPGVGLDWIYTPPCVSCDCWPVYKALDAAPFTTVSHWNTADEWLRDEENQVYSNDKRVSFAPFFSLPRYTTQRLELALTLDGDAQERDVLTQQGWEVREAWDVTGTPWDYQHYIQRSRGEFSCVKPSCLRLQNAWISDRTLCYLASGKPAIVQHTGPSRFLPDAEGLFRFRTLEEAASSLERAGKDYDYHCKAARALAQEYFDAAHVVPRLLERALA